MNAWMKTVQYYFIFHNKAMAFTFHPSTDTLLQWDGTWWNGPY